MFVFQFLEICTVVSNRNPSSLYRFCMIHCPVMDRYIDVMCMYALQQPTLKLVFPTTYYLVDQSALLAILIK